MIIKEKRDVDRYNFEYLHNSFNTIQYIDSICVKKEKRVTCIILRIRTFYSTNKLHIVSID
jgi:hypothetical protein